ncbi:MAG: hypothetical protein ACK59M_01700, partial [Pseudomonadota bacterium]
AFAFHHADRVAAVATGAGSLPLNPRPGPCTTGPSRPLPILILHGDADLQMPWPGGCVANVGGNCNRGRVISAEATRDRWLQINGLQGAVPTQSTVEVDLTDGGPAQRFDYAGANPLQWWRLIGAGHTSPSRTVLVPPSNARGIQNRDIEFAEVVWAFFKSRLDIADSSDYTGGWWRADESGWGLFTIDQGNVLLPTWFTYDTQGQATWFVIAGASLQDDGSYRGDVYRYTGVPFAQISGTASETGTVVGSARLRFPARDRMIFDYTVDGVSQSKELNRFEFGDKRLECSGSTADPAGFSNYTALWWNPNQSGWGVQINHVGDLLSATWYTYGEDRKPAWFVFNATRQVDGRYTGPLLRGRTGTPFDQINGQPAAGQIEEVGTVSLRFANGAAGEFSYTVGGSTRSVPISRAEFGSRRSECRSRQSPSPPIATPYMALLGAAVEGGIEEVARAVDFDGGGGIFVVGSMAPGAQLRSSAGGPTLTAAGSAGTDAFVAY